MSIAREVRPNSLAQRKVSAMRVLVFGSVRVVGASQQHRFIGPAKQRALLAALTLSLDQLVPLETIIECLWGTEPPSTAANLVRQYVSSLRREALGDLTDIELVTRPSGYCLSAARDQVDIFCFEQRLRDGQLQLQAGDANAAIVSADDALRLAQGPALTDVLPSPVILAERERLTELVTAAKELRAAGALAAGRAHEAVLELRGLLAKNPYDEGLYAQLMHALSASGRHADALGVYRAARRILIRELGVEPGAELRHLEKQILTGTLQANAEQRSTSACDPVQKADSSPTIITPLLIGQQTPLFVGRDRELTEATETLRRPGAARQLIVLTGPAGIGKTALAARLGHCVADRFSDGMLLLDLRPLESGQPVTPNEALEQLLTALGMHRIPDGVAARRHALDQLLTARRMLVVLDGAVNEAQVRPLLMTELGCATVVTSRNVLAGFDADYVATVGTLCERSSWSLFVHLLGQDRIRGEERPAREIVEMCGGIPVALRAAAIRLRNLAHRSLAEFAERLRGDRMLDELAVGELAVKERVGAIYRALTPAGQRVVQRLAAMRLEPRQSLALSWFAEHFDVEDDTLDRMIEAGALEAVNAPTGQGPRFCCLELLRRFVQTDVSNNRRRTERIAPIVGVSRPAGRSLSQVC